jgi:hypothetical protein
MRNYDIKRKKGAHNIHALWHAYKQHFMARNTLLERHRAEDYKRLRNS